MSLKTQQFVRLGEVGITAATAISSIVLNYLNIPEESLTPEIIQNIGEGIRILLAADLTTFSIRERNSSEVKYIADFYKSVLDHSAYFFNEINVKNPFLLYYLFNIMYSNGFFSYGKIFSPYEAKPIDLPFLSGVDVIRGYGSSRHITSLLNDIYKTMGFESYILPCRLYSGDDNKGKIHVINIVSSDSKCAYLDPANEMEFTKSSNFLINNDKSFTIKQDFLYKLAYLMLFASSDLLKVKKASDLMKCPNINQRKLAYYKKEATKMFEEMYSEFISFHFFLENIYEKIWNATEKISPLSRRLIPLFMKRENK